MRKKFGFVTARKLSYLETSLQRHLAKREEVVRSLNELNAALTAGLIDQEHYLEHRYALFDGQSEDQWEAEHSARVKQLEETIGGLKHEHARTDFKDSAKKALTFVVVALMIVAALAGIPIQPQITGLASDSGGFQSEANITAYFAVAMSGNMSDGISYGTISADTNSNNATDNYNDGSSGSTMYMAVSSDSNVPVDLCVKADGNLTSTDSEVDLNLANMVWDSDTSTDADTPSLASAVAMTNSYANTETNVAGGSNAYHRFWLTVPIGQPGGTYNNTVSFGSVQTGQSC